MQKIKIDSVHHPNDGPAFAQWAGGGFDDFLNLMNFLVFLIL